MKLVSANSLLVSFFHSGFFWLTLYAVKSIFFQERFPNQWSQAVCRGNIRGPFERFVDWRQCAAVMQRETVTVMLSCSGGSNVVVARSSSL
jgi:hypothetical protein